MRYLENIPQPLYKYRVWNEVCKERQLSRRMLTENEVYLSSANQFNDPFDCSLPYKYRDEDYTPENIFLKLLKVGRDLYPDVTEDELHKICYERQHSGAFETQNYWKKYYPKFKSDINEVFGILSLTPDKSNILMWSHYADSHKGFCVGLDKNILFECCEGIIEPVSYNDKFPEIGMFEDSPLSLMALTTTKSVQWEYEKEYRLVKINGARKVVSLPNEAILEIILGCRMPDEYKESIYQIANEKFPDAKLYEAKENDEGFTLDFLPILK